MDRHRNKSAPDREGLGDRNVGAALTAFFPDGFPTASDAQQMWSVIRRDALAGAVRRAGDPYFRVISTPIEGVPLHVHGTHTVDHESDHFTRGIAALGALGYALLRSQRAVLRDQWRRARALRDRYESLLAELMAARSEEIADADLTYVEGSRLLFWETLGVLLPVSEQLANLVSAIDQWRGSRADLGMAILTGEAVPHRVFANPSFQSMTWWRRQLGLRGGYSHVRFLSRRQRALLTEISQQTAALVADGVRDLRNTWNEELHRVAVRYKHASTLLSASHGLAWPSGVTTEGGRDLIAEIYAAGGLFVADVRQGRPTQLAVEVTIGGMDVLVETLFHALALTDTLIHALMQRAEHTTGLIVPLHHLAPAVASQEELLELLARAAGVSDQEWAHGLEGERAKLATQEAIRTAAKQWQAAEPSAISIELVELVPEDDENAPGQERASDSGESSE